ncbi:putative ribonuclease H-like domain-containing protein [Tanacetum coccineum]
MLVQVYVDDIIFSSTRKSWCDEFEALMKKRFQMSSMGELTFFLGLQVKQKVDGIFICRDKYVAEILKKFDFMSVKHASTPIETHKPLAKDEEAADVDVHLYRFQVTPKTSHLYAMKRIFKYLKGKPKVGLWYPKESSFDLVAYSDSDYGGNNLDRKSIPQQEVSISLCHSLYGLLCEQKDIDHGDDFHEVIWGYRESLERDINVSTTFVEQFWMSAKSKTINNVKYINAKVAGKPVTISEASIRSDLLFYDADGIDVLNNQAIFDAIQQMSAPLFPTMLVQPTEDEGEGLERQSEPQPTPSPPHTIEAHVEPQPNLSPRSSPSIPIPDPILEGFGGNHGGQSSSDRYLSGNEGDLTLQSVYDLYFSLCTQVTAQAAEIKALKAQVKKLKKQARPFILHNKACLRAVKRKKQQKEKVLKTSKQRRSVSKQGRKSAKTPTSVHKDQAFDDLDNFDGIDYMETDAYKEEGVEEGTAELEDNEPKEITTQVAQTTTPITPTPTPTTFGDDETIAQVLLNMSQAKAVLKEKEKGVELKDVEDIERPRLTSTRSLLTLKPLPKIDPKDKGKKRIEEDDESDTESDDEAEEEKKRLAEEEATKAALSNEYDFIQTRIEADRLLAVRIQEVEREQFTVEEEQNLFMTPLQLKEDSLLNKEIKILYEKIKRFDDSFIAVGSTEDERKIKEMNERAGDPDKKRLKKKVVKEDDTAKPDVDSDDEHRKCLRIVALDSTIDSEVMETKSVIARLNKVSSPDGDYLVIYRANGNFSAFNYLLEVLHIFDRQDLFHLYDLVMEQYSEITLEGIKLILRGDLKIMMESSTEANDQELKDGTVIHMLVERRYPLSLLQRMLDLGLEIKKESTAALHLLKDNEPKESTTQVAQTTTPITPTSTPTTFRGDETITQVLLNMSQAKAVSKEKEKGVELKDVEDIERPRPTSTKSLLTLKPLPKIDPKDKGKKRIEEDDESDTESDDVTAAEKKFKQARIEASRLLAVRIQEAKREQFTVEEEQNFFMTPLLLKEDSLLNKDERKIKEMNERAGDLDKKRLKKKVVKEDDTAKVPAKQDMTKQGTKKRKGGHIKMIARKKSRPQLDVDSDDEYRKCLRIVALDSTIDSEVMETKSVIARLNKVSSPDGDYLVIYKANGNFSAFNYLLEVLHIFDRQDLFHLYDLVMEQYSEITPKGDFWNNQQDWEIVRWRLYEACEVYILELKDGTVIHMLVERRYPLSLLQRMLNLGLEIEKESTVALHLGSQLTLLLSKELASLGSNSS